MRLAFIALALTASSALAAGTEPSSPADVVSKRGLKGTITLDMLPVPPDWTLVRGAIVWEGRCNACHSHKNATGAPKITSLRAWEPRIEQGLPVLFEHAIRGFMGPKFLEMPPRGGDPDLTDDEVHAAVAFMVWMSGGDAIVDTWLSELESKK